MTISLNKNHLPLGAPGNRLEAVENELKEIKEGALKAKKEAMKAKKEVMEVKKKMKEMEKEVKDRESCLATVEAYTRLSQVLHNHWFTALPEDITRLLKTGPSSNIPRALSSWWIIWNHINPTSYPLPSSLCQHGKLSISDYPEWKDHLIRNGQETQLGAAVRQAWDFITPVDRELMLFCWAIKQEYHTERTGIGHPELTLMNAFIMVDCDLTEDLQWLHDRALVLMAQIFN